MRISIASQDSAAWFAACKVVREFYASAYDAEVEPRPDCFVVVTSTDPGTEDRPQVWACAGLTMPTDAPFFSERYLWGDVESALGNHIHGDVQKSRIVEVGPLASHVARAGTEAVRATPILAWYMGFEYILCTVTRPLSGLLAKLGIVFVPVAEASPSALSPVARKKWGSYYEQNPVVGVIPLSQVTRLFSEATGRYRPEGFAPSMLMTEDGERGERRRALR